MMAHPIIRATLGLLLILVYIHTLKDSGGVQAEQIEELQTKSEQSLLQGIEQPQLRIAREAGGEDAKGRQNKKISNKKLKGKGKTKRTEIKLRQGKKKLRQKKKKSRKNKTKRRNLKKKKKKKVGNKKKKSKGNQKKSRRNQKKSRKGYKNMKKNRKVSKQNKKRSKKNQNKQKQTKGKRWKHVKELSQHKQNTNGTACDEKALGQKIKDYIKISNQLRMVRRIKKACSTMENKANKSGNVFEATVNALTSALGSSSGRRMYLTRSRWRRSSECKGELTGIKDKLKNCSKSAKAKCQKSSVEACQNEAQNNNCEKELKGWIDKFGPSNTSCLQDSDNYCPCITALPDVSKDCLKFDKISKMAINSKKKCTSGDEKGSFGFCKKLQIQAAEKGPGAGKCQPTGIDNTTAGVITTTRKPTTSGSSEGCHDKDFLDFKHKAALHFDEILANLTDPKSRSQRCLPSSCQPTCKFSQFSSCSLPLWDALRACALDGINGMKECMDRQVNAVPREECIPCVCKAIYIQYSKLTPGCTNSDGCPSVCPASCTSGDSCDKNNYALVLTGGDNPQRLGSSEQISYMGVCSSPNIPLLPEPITGGKSVWIDCTLMFCGGSPTYVGGGPVSGATNKCLKLTPGNNYWDSIPSYNMNVDRSWFSLNSINGEVVAAGGLAKDNTVRDTLEIYSGGKWKKSDITLDKPTYVHCAVSYTRGGDSYLMIIGGSNTYGKVDLTASVTEINLSTGDKVSVAPGPLPGLWAPACTICGDDIYVSGGGKQNGLDASQTTDVYKYNIPTGGPFTLLTGKLNTPRWGHTMGVTSKGQLVISGGWEPGYLASIESSEDGGASWKTWGPGLSTKQEYPAMASVPAFTFTCTG